MRKWTFSIAGLLLGLVITCSTVTQVPVQLLKPAAIYMPGVKKIAIADFQGQDRSGSQIATMIQSYLMQTQHFDIMERDKLNRILDEQNLGMSGIVDEASAARVGQLLGVDALIFGEVTKYEVPPDQRRVKKVKEKKHTGKYETVTEIDKKTGKKKKKRQEIVEDVWVEREYFVRSGTVAINFRVVSVENGKLLAAHSDSKSYDSEKEPQSFFASLTNEQKPLKPQGEILSDLSEAICKKFVRMIAPYYVTENRTIEPGEGSIEVGKNYATSGLWPEAIEAWTTAIREQPQIPAGYYDLGLAFEIQGDYDRAEASYKKALGLKQKKLYMDAVARIRQLKKEQEKLQQQLNEREDSSDTDW